MTATEAPPSPRVWDHRFFFPVLILFIVIGFYWKITLTKQYDWVWGPDLAQQVLPWFEEEARQIQHSELPLWDPHMWLGQPMLGQAQPGTAYPLNWVLFLMPRTRGHIPAAALQWYYVVIHYMAALFCFLLCRDLGRSRAAALIAGLLFSFGGYVGTTDWPQMVNGAVWAPLVLMFLLRAVRGVRPLVSAALCGTFLGMAWLAGHHQVPIYTTLTMLGIWLYYIVRENRIRWDFVKLAAVSLIFLALVSALQVLPAQEYGKLAKRWAGADHEIAWNEAVPYYVHQMYGTDPVGLFGILIPGLNHHADPFIGVVALVLVLLAVALCWKQHAVKLFATVGCAALVYSLGHHSVFHGFLYAVVPMLEKARVPSMAVVIFNTAVAVLVAFGVDHFGKLADSVWERRITIGALGFGLLTFTMMLGAMFVHKLSWEMDDRVGLTAFVALLLAGLLYAWRTGNLTSRQGIVLLTLLMLLELGNDSGYAFASRADKDRMSFIEKVRSNKDLADFLHQQSGAFRIEVDTEELAVNWGNYYNFDIFKGLGASVTVNVLDMEFHTWQTRMLYGIRYTIGEKPPLADSREIFAGASGLKVYENPNAFPRAWAVHELTQIKTPNEGRVIINGQLDDLRWNAFTQEKPVALQTCPGGQDQVAVKRYTGETVALEAKMACEGLVILSDTYFPGWKASVDGRPVQIHEVNMAMRGIVVPQGSHQIVMKYRPMSVYLGAFLTLVGWLGALGMVLFGPGRKRAV